MHQLILRGVNPDLSIIRLNGGLGRGITVDASTIKDVVNGTYMNTPRAATFRNLTCPGWHVAHTSAELASVPAASGALPTFAAALSSDCSTEDDDQSGSRRVRSRKPAANGIRKPTSRGAIAEKY